MNGGFFKFKTLKRSMQEKQTTKPPEERRKPAEELEKKPLLSYVPKKLKVAAEVAIVLAFSFFVGTAGADELTLPENAENLLAQKEYTYYSYDILGTLDSTGIALFYETTDGTILPFEEQGYFITTWGETLWTETEHRVEGAGPYEGAKYWITTTRGAKVLPGERGGKDVTTTYHGTPEDSLFKEVTVESWWYGETSPYEVNIDYWALDSTASIAIFYSAGDEYFSLMMSPPTDTISVDDIELRVTEGGIVRPTNFRSGLAYQNPFNTIVTIRTGEGRSGPVRIIDSSGRNVVAELENDNREIRWDASNFESGKFWAIWPNKDGTWTVTDLTLIK